MITYSLQLLALVALLAHQIVIVTPFKVLAPCKALPRTSSVLNRHTDTALSSSRRTFLSRTSSLIPLTFLAQLPQPARAVGPVKVPLTVKSYSARVCPPDRPIPGEKAMKGMRGLCVTVKATITSPTEKRPPLTKVGVYGFITDSVTGESVLANNPDLSTDAGQFTIIESVGKEDVDVEFDFIAAVPKEIDVTQFDNGIQPLKFASLKLVSFPGGQQYGAISPCEMDEFSMECEDWENENGKYEKADYMIKSNERTKGR